MVKSGKNAPSPFGYACSQGCKFCIFGQPGCEPKKSQGAENPRRTGKKDKKEEKKKRKKERKEKKGEKRKEDRDSEKKREWKKLE